MKVKGLEVTPKVIVQLLIVVVLIPCLPLLITWRWGWWEAWAYAFVSIAGFVGSRWLVAGRHADLLAERARMVDHADAEPWDRVLAPLVGVGGGLIPLIAGFEALWMPVPVYGLPVKAAALAVLVTGYALGTYALLENRFFSGVVRIQTDRDHRVVATGPYGWIRHPGYTGALMAFLAAPFLLDGRWALVASVLLAIALVVRTRLEDQTLQAKLPGYSEYAGRVRYRLLPGVW